MYFTYTLWKSILLHCPPAYVPRGGCLNGILQKHCTCSYCSINIVHRKTVATLPLDPGLEIDFSTNCIVSIEALTKRKVVGVFYRETLYPGPTPPPPAVLYAHIRYPLSYAPGEHLYRNVFKPKYYIIEEGSIGSWEYSYYNTSLLSRHENYCITIA